MLMCTNRNSSARQHHLTPHQANQEPRGHWGVKSSTTSTNTTSTTTSAAVGSGADVLPFLTSFSPSKSSSLLLLNVFSTPFLPVLEICTFNVIVAARFFFLFDKIRRIFMQLQKLQELLLFHYSFNLAIDLFVLWLRTWFLPAAATVLPVQVSWWVARLLKVLLV